MGASTTSRHPLARKRERIVVPRVFVAAIDDVPIVAFEATNLQDATSLKQEAWFQEDLRALRLAGAPIWDGNSRIAMRRATDEEEARYQRAAVGDADDLKLVYLIELD